MSRKLYPVLALVTAGFLIFLGLQTGGGDVTCSNRTMKPGETCTRFGQHSKTTRDYDEQRAYQSRLRWILWGAAGLFIAGAPVLARRPSERAGHERRASGSPGLRPGRGDDGVQQPHL